MHRRFRRIAFAALTTTGLAASLSGCVQMTRHSNTLVFGTNTSFGVKVGTDATSTPGINVGYTRQEAVIIPVVANTADNGDVQMPCPQAVAPGMAKADLTENCRLVANDGTDSDTFSVLANFGSKYAANGGTAPSVNGEISQYFATGHAARLLAEKAGASAIATGPAATAASEGASERKSAIMTARSQVAANLRGAADLTAYLKALDGAARSDTDFQEACDKIVDKNQCAVVIERGGLPTGLSVKEWAAAASVK